MNKFVVKSGTASVYEGDCSARAQATYETYVGVSKEGAGHLGNADVSLAVDGKVVVSFNHAEWVKNGRKDEANNGSRSWGMALNDNPDALPPTRPGNAGMWMKESVNEGKCKECGCKCTGDICADCDDEDDESDDADESSTPKNKVRAFLDNLAERDTKSAAQIKKMDRARRKRERRGRGAHSTAAIRKASRMNLKKSKAKRAGNKSMRKGARTRARRERLRGS